MTPQTRREFLRTAGAAGMSLAVAPVLGCEVAEETPFEGIYTDKFTYAQGEPIRVFLALQSEATVNVRLFRDDTPSSVNVLVEPVRTYRFGRVRDAGELGADFVASKVLFTDDLEPGVYGVAIDASELQPANRLNSYNPFTSQNHFARFVITSATAGTRARTLWVRDSLTGVAYGSFGGQSIYGFPPVIRRNVSLLRPGLGISTLDMMALRFLRQRGYEFEYTDLAALAAESGKSLRAAYDLIVFIGCFEYVPTAALEAVEGFLRLGGNGFFAANEFAGFRVRLSSSSQLTTYRTFYEIEDPLYGVPGSESDVAGTGMTMPRVLRETEVIGNTFWAPCTRRPTGLPTRRYTSDPRRRGCSRGRASGMETSCPRRSPVGRRGRSSSSWRAANPSCCRASTPEFPRSRTSGRLFRPRPARSGGTGTAIPTSPAGRATTGMPRPCTSNASPARR